MKGKQHWGRVLQFGRPAPGFSPRAPPVTCTDGGDEALLALLLLQDLLHGSGLFRETRDTARAREATGQNLAGNFGRTRLQPKPREI